VQQVLQAENKVDSVAKTVDDPRVARDKAKKKLLILLSCIVKGYKVRRILKHNKQLY
jgi:thiamine biosynthesis lipoprotein ApbE